MANNKKCVLFLCGRKTNPTYKSAIQPMPQTTLVISPPYHLKWRVPNIYKRVSSIRKSKSGVAEESMEYVDVKGVAVILTKATTVKISVTI